MERTNSIWNILTTIKIYAFAILIFSTFRFILFLNELSRIDQATTSSDIIYSFVMGIRFDIVICGYIMIIPFILLTIYSLNPKYDFLKKVVFYFVLILFSIAFAVNSVDIPYFKQFFSRFSVTAFEWFDSPLFVVKMIIEEPRYWLYILPAIIAYIVFYKILKNIIYSKTVTSEHTKPWLQVVFSVLFLGLILIGIRGRLEEKSPIRVGTAFFCSNPFLNQLGLNPNFTLIRSALDKMKEENKPIKFMSEEVAIANVQKYLNIKNPNPSYPILREENKTDSIQNFKNIVIVIMESMSTAKMGIHGNKYHLTPFLDSISKSGYYFENTYTAGIHTFNGIFSTLFSYPAIFKQHPMKNNQLPKYDGIATATKKNGYSTIYFTTHDGQFDNVEGFLTTNDFEKVVSQKDYPSEKIKTTLGVPDDYMFEYSIPILNNLSKKKKPFLSVFMTASDHGPYYVPNYFKPKNTEIKKQVVEYADYSLKKFIQLSMNQPWYKNTLFVFVADHGAPLDTKYNISLNYNHSPLIFYQPNIIKENKTFTKMAGQIDIYPSVMGLLGIPFENNTLGINLFKEDRPYIYFNADDKYGVIDENWLLIVMKDNSTGLYKYKKNDLKDYKNQNPDIVKKMKDYAESNLQVFQYIKTNKTK